MKPINLQRRKPRVPLTSLRINSQRDLELIQKDLMLVILSNPEIRDGDTPRCTNHPSSKAPNWTWEYKGGKSGRELNAPKDPIQCQLVAFSAFETQSSERIY